MSLLYLRSSEAASMATLCRNACGSQSSGLELLGILQEEPEWCSTMRNGGYAEQSKAVNLSSACLSENILCECEGLPRRQGPLAPLIFTKFFSLVKRVETELDTRAKVPMLAGGFSMQGLCHGHPGSPGFC